MDASAIVLSANENDLQKVMAIRSLPALAPVEVLSEIIRAANFDAPIRDNIRYSVWLKLWGFNPISANRTTITAGICGWRNGVD
jgi:ketopantoate reductase